MKAVWTATGKKIHALPPGKIRTVCGHKGPHELARYKWRTYVRWKPYWSTMVCRRCVMGLAA